MAFGISPKHIQEISLEGLSTEEFLALALEGAKLETWEIGTVKKNGFIAYSGFSLSSYGEEIKMTIENGNATIKSECTGSQILDHGRNKNNIGNLIINISNLKEKLSREELTELTNTLSIKGDDLLPESALETKSKVSDILAIFKPTEGYFITPILININIAVMIIMILTGVSAINPSGEDLLTWGANYRAMTLDGGWWRLLTCCFLHIGIVHLLMNMYALLYIGVLLEPILGRTRFLVAYLVTGIAASVTSLAWHDLIISAGASGAIFGMYGIFLAMLTTNLIERSARKAMLSSVLIFVGYNLLNGLQGSVDNAAHIGGLVSGMLVGYIFYPALKDKDAIISEKYSIRIISVGVIVATIFIYFTTTNAIGIYDRKMTEFLDLEREALVVYNLSDTTSQVSMLRILKNPGMANWKKCLKIVDDVNGLNLPMQLKERNKLMRIYCNIRLETYNLLHDLTKDTTQRERINAEIENLNINLQKTIEAVEQIK